MTETADAGNALIQVAGLVKRYGEFTALDTISFSIRKGEIVGFLGPNGAGKTTTMKIITGYIPATAGEVTIDGDNIFADSLACRKKIGYLPEDVPLYNDMKVTAYLTYVCRLREVPKSEIPFKLDRIITECSLEPVKDKLIRQLSKGNRQRVGLAQALIHAPQILVLDEPTVGLDPQQVINIRELITRLRKDHTVILSTHILSEVEQMCDRVIIINHGRICLDRPLDGKEDGSGLVYRLEVNGPAAEVREYLSRDGGLEQELETDDARLVCTCRCADTAAAEALSREVVSRGWGLTEFTPQRGDLETVFLNAIRE